jgi:hypothetical protein
MREEMSSKRCLLVAIIALVLASSACSEATPSRRPPVQLEGLTLCQGWSDEGLPLYLEDSVPADEERICVCGEFVMSQTYYLKIVWAREEDISGYRVIYRDVRAFQPGTFSSCIESDGEFSAGNYHARVVAEKTSLGIVEFTVTEVP